MKTGDKVTNIISKQHGEVISFSRDYTKVSVLTDPGKIITDEISHFVPDAIYAADFQKKDEESITEDREESTSTPEVLNSDKPHKPSELTSVAHEKRKRKK